jgi:TonB family protein
VRAAILVLGVVVAAVASADPATQAKAVEEALASVSPKLHRCWEQVAASDYRVEGQIELKVIIGPAGRAARVEVQGNSLGKKDLEACALRAFADASFGTAFEPGDAVEVPITFKAEPNVTLKQKDAPELAMKGTQAYARILVDEKTSGATRASLTFVDVTAGSRWMRPNGNGTAFVFVNKGRASVGANAVTIGDVLVFPEGSAHPLRASVRTELLVLLTPPGGEQAYRDGATMGQTASGPEPRVVKAASEQKFTIADGKGDVRILVEKDRASVARLRLGPGAVVPEHVHAGEAEILYILQGTGTMTVDGSKYPVEPFMAVHVPPGVKHAFTVTSDQSVEAVQFYTPSGPEQRFKR